MPLYDFKCLKCDSIQTVQKKIGDRQPVECCGRDMERVFTKAPGTVIPPSQMAVKDKLKYYGVKNVVTGEGINKDTDVSTPPGIT